MTTPPVTIYTAMLCPYCSAARRLLDAKGVSYEDIDVTFKPALRQAMTQRAGGRTSVPQVFVGEQHLGGSDDLHALEREGRLDAILAGSA